MKISNYVYLEVECLSTYLDKAKIKTYVKYDFSNLPTQIEFKDVDVLKDNKGHYIKYCNKKYYLKDISNKYKDL